MAARMPLPGLSAVDYDPFAAGELQRVVPTTEPQREVWLAHKLGREASLAYNESVTLHLRGALDEAALNAALQELIARHDSLRATFGPDGETFCVHEQAHIEIARTDLSKLDAEAREQAVTVARRQAVQTLFDLEHGPLFRAQWLTLGDREHALLLTAHHIVCDGWSWWVIVRELGALMNRHAGETVAELPPADGFADYALAQAMQASTRESAADEAYWLQRFADPVAPLELPTDRPRPARRSFSSGYLEHALDADLLAGIRKLGGHQGASLFATLVGAFAALLSRLSQQDEVVVGIPAAGQSVDGHDNLIGHCVNVLPLRFGLTPDTTVSSLTAAAQATMLDAFEHQRYTFGTLLKKLRIERDPGRLPLVSVLFNIDQALDAEAAHFPGLDLEFSTNPRCCENFELFINSVQTSDGLRFEVQYNATLFDAATVEQWFRSFETLLRGAVEHPESATLQLPLLADSDRVALESLQPQPVAYDREVLVHQIIEACCDCAPERIAVRCGESALSYAELDARANVIARALRQQGIHRGARVGLAVERGPDMIAALLGVLKSGAAYVPLDPAFPKARLEYMMADAELAALVTQRRHAQSFELGEFPLLMLEDVLAATDASRLERDDEGAARESVAYVIYTSGSTGKPKGVQVPHRAVVNFLAGMQREPGLTADDRLLAVTTLSFDIALLELLLPLCVGSEVIIADRDQAMDGQALKTLLTSCNASVMQATPATWRLLIDAGWQGDSGFRVLCGGEALTADLAGELVSRCDEVWNLYGPTETTIWSTCWKVGHPEMGISIGRPIANTTVWVRDARGRRCPMGVPGELCIGGDGVALGYLKRDELTAERFVTDPYSHTPGARLYRSGDRGRWRADGTLQHLGRIDDQIKLRGYRIELGEIEAQLTGHADIAEAVAVVREDRPGDRRLVGYAAGKRGTALDCTAVRAHLARALPEYMIPQHLVGLDAIPRLPNGKVDRNALPAPEVQLDPGAAMHEAPHDDLQRTIAAAMEQVLGVSGIGIRDDFFALGGHSLLAAQLTTRLNRDLDMSLSLRVVFDAPSVAKLAQIIAQESSSTAQAPRLSIPRRAEQSRAPLSLMQERLWLLEELSPGNITYNIPSAHGLIGPLDEVLFERAFGELIKRQPVLRTAIGDGNDGNDDHAQQIIQDDLAVSLLPATDLSHLSADERETELRRQMDAMTGEPFDLRRAPLFRIRLFKLAAEHHVLYFMPHHMIWDGWSFDLMYQDLGEIYAALLAEREPELAELPVSYGDFSLWHRQWIEGPEYARQLEFWRERMAGERTHLVLPADKPRKPRMSGRSTSCAIAIDLELVSALSDAGRGADATMFMTLLTAYFALLNQMTRQRDLIIGTPMRGRNSAEVEGLMGFFTTLLPLRIDIDPALSFRDAVRRVKSIVLESFAHPDIRLEDVMGELNARRDVGGSALYQALFSFQDIRARELQWGNVLHKRMPLYQPGATEDVGLWFVQDEHGLSGGVLCNADIFHPETAELLRQRYLHILRAVAADPSQPLAALTEFAKDDVVTIARWNTSKPTSTEESTLAAILDRRADSAPERAALSFRGEDSSYDDLRKHAHRLAAVLHHRGVRRGDTLAVCAYAGPDRLATMLAALDLGATCALLDPADPIARLHTQLALIDVSLLIADSATASALEWSSQRCLCFDTDADEIAAMDGCSMVTETFARTSPDIAFVIFEPDPNGAQRAISIGRAALENLLHAAPGALGIDEDDRWLAAAPPGGALSIVESLVPLMVGARIVQAGQQESDRAEGLASALLSSYATVLVASGDCWQQLLETGWLGRCGFHAICDDDTPGRDIAARLLEQGNRLSRVYGHSESGIWSCAEHIENAADGLDIGRPLRGHTLWVLDGDGSACPIAREGEICIGGIGLVPGLHGEHVLTGAPANADPAPPAGAYPLYRTGDRGRWLANGTLILTSGRVQRLRFRGRSMQPREIESLALSDAGVGEAACVLHDGVRSESRLLLYVVGSTPDKDLLAHLRGHLAETLPMALLPELIRLPALPRTADGGIDRDVLLAWSPAPTEAAIQAPRTPPVRSIEDPRQRYLGAIWRELTQVSELRANDNFFDIGGHSLLAVEMAARVQRDTGVRLNLLAIATRTLGSLAAELPQMDLAEQAQISAPRRSGLATRLRRFLGLG